jgi:hypothetical protein
MNYDNLFIFIITHVKQVGGNGRGVVVIRQTPILEITKLFDLFLSREDISKIMKFKKITDDQNPNMVVYQTEGTEEHIVFGISEQGWKGDYGLTHNDMVVSIH